MLQLPTTSKRKYIYIFFLFIPPIKLELNIKFFVSIYKIKLRRQRLSSHLQVPSLLESLYRQITRFLSLSLSRRLILKVCRAHRSTRRFVGRRRRGRRKSQLSLKHAVDWVNILRRKVALEILASAWHATPNQLVRILSSEFFVWFSTFGNFKDGCFFFY